VPVALVDDHPGKKGSEIHGVRVRGQCRHIPELVDKLGIEAILIAVPSATDLDMRRIVEICESTRVPFLTLPSVQEMLSEQQFAQLREVSIEDLLGRTHPGRANTCHRRWRFDWFRIVQADRPLHAGGTDHL
jgi:FlaA1/EpsC-like NDP-sugar epimerase